MADVIQAQGRFQPKLHETRPGSKYPSDLVDEGLEILTSFRTIESAELRRSAQDFVAMVAKADREARLRE